MSARRCSSCGEPACNVEALDAARGKGASRKRIEAQRVYVDALIACTNRGKADWPGIVLAAELLLAKVRALHAAWADGDEPEGAPSAGRTLEQIGALIGGGS